MCLERTTAWYLLPYEIRHQILQVLVKDGPSISRYASVCPEWQQVIEQENFRQIRLTPSCLPDVRRIARRRHGHLECIRYYIRLQAYGCWQRNKRMSQDWRETDNRTVEYALRDLFTTLSIWPSRGRPLTLDVNIFSPSDAKHYFKKCYCHDASRSIEDIPDKSDSCHGWDDGRRIMLPPCDATWRVFPLIELGEDFWRELPQVSAITKMQVRRQNYRQIEPQTLRRLLTFLPMLHTFCYEPRRKWFRKNQKKADKSYLTLFPSLTATRLENLIIFEDFDDEYLNISPPDDECLLLPEPRRIANSAVSGALAQASLALEILSASFIVDAMDFFSACRPVWTWHKLTLLALTSRTLVPSGDGHTEINDLLQSGAKVVMNIPRLTTLTLWNYDGSNAGTFVYQNSHAERLAKIVWRATWITVLEPATIRLWEAVALKHGAPELRTAIEGLDASVALRSRGDAIQHLRLPAEVVQAQSLNQILAEKACE